ncbi:MAG: anaerobic sulfatase maturase [Planctomycetes bacterium]|nr:anaerobic sulfatase maturase [Planctomycetota bacterium]
MAKETPQRSGAAAVQPAMYGVPSDPSAFHTLAKPIGPICNLDCTYCFYLHKENFFPKGENFRMSEATLEAFTKQYIEAQDVPEINFAWQGGEPTLLGVEFFRKAVELQKRYAPEGKTITNALQTNGVLLDDEWCAFLKENDVLVGLSIDGPKDVHDKYRYYKDKRSSHDDVMRGLRLLQKHGVRVNSLTCVNRATGSRGREVYRFLRDECNFEHMQFIPIVEKIDFETVAPGTENPGGPDPDDDLLKVTPWTVKPEQFGRFMCAVFDEWARADVGKVFVQTFEQTLAGVLGMPASLCVFSKRCGRALAIEHDGGLFSCDHFVYGDYKLGNIHDKTMRQMAASEQQKKFGNDKFDTLPRYCRTCEFLELCYGECPKNRFIQTPDGEDGLNYLCAGYKIYFAHATPVLAMMAREIREGRPAAGIMRAIQAAEQVEASKASGSATATAAPKPNAKPRPNDQCPCGSGKKFKKCHGA